MTAYISLCRHIMKKKIIGTVIEQWYPVVERIGGDSRLVILNDGSKDATYKKITELSEKS